MKLLSVLSLSLIFGAGCANLRDTRQTAYAEACSVGICYVHHVAMTKREVPVAYGLIAFTPDDLRLMKKFPFQGQAFGGCVITAESPAEREVWVCSDCQSDAQKYARSTDQPTLPPRRAF